MQSNQHSPLPFTNFEIRAAHKSEDYLEALELFKEYFAFLGQDLNFQGIAEEFSNPAGMYGPPNGLLLLAWVNKEVTGCVAFRQKSKEVCEMKRLYLRKGFRGLGIAKALCTHLLENATSKGYQIMRLDTLNTLKEAHTLYKQIGFFEIPPYYYNPLPNVIYMEKQL